MTVLPGTSTAPCVGCTSPDGIAGPSGEYGVWIANGVNSINGSQNWSWRRQMPVPYPADVQSTATPSIANPVAFNQPVVAPGANQPISISGSVASTSNPTVDSQRRVVGQVPNGPAFSNPA
jgi:hypothetical protein